MFLYLSDSILVRIKLYFSKLKLFKELSTTGKILAVYDFTGLKKSELSF